MQARFHDVNALVRVKTPGLGLAGHQMATPSVHDHGLGGNNNGSGHGGSGGAAGQASAGGRRSGARGGSRNNNW